MAYVSLSGRPSIHFSPRRTALAAFLLLSALSFPLVAQVPAGLAASALADPASTWIPRTTPGFREVPPLNEPLDLFFVDSREQMGALIGGRATGFAEPSARAVFLMTNPVWRAFERHEIMHVIAGQAWGHPGPNTDWLQERQSAVFVDYLLREFGPAPLERLWREGATLGATAAGRSLAVIESEWRAGLGEPERPGPAELDVIESKGCG